MHTEVGYKHAVYHSLVVGRINLGVALLLVAQAIVGHKVVRTIVYNLLGGIGSHLPHLVLQGYARLHSQGSPAVDASGVLAQLTFGRQHLGSPCKVFEDVVYNLLARGTSHISLAGCNDVVYPRHIAPHCGKQEVAVGTYGLNLACIHVLLGLRYLSLVVVVEKLVAGVYALVAVGPIGCNGETLGSRQQSACHLGNALCGVAPLACLSTRLHPVEHIVLSESIVARVESCTQLVAGLPVGGVGCFVVRIFVEK